MSATEDLFLQTDLPPVQAAHRLAEALDMDLEIRDGRAYLGRDGIDTVTGWVAGEVYRNIYSEDNPEPGERTVFDGYPLVWEIFRRGPDRGDYDLQRAAARAVFDAVTTGLRWPAVLTHDLQTVVATWDPDRGLREFPPHTPVDDPTVTR